MLGAIARLNNQMSHEYRLIDKDEYLVQARPEFALPLVRQRSSEPEFPVLPKNRLRPRSEVNYKDTLQARKIKVKNPESVSAET